MCCAGCALYVMFLNRSTVCGCVHGVVYANEGDGAEALAEEDDGSGDEEDDAGAKRGKYDHANGLKSKFLPQKFLKVKSSLPKEICDLWESTQAHENRAAQAEFFNELFDKNDKGQWVVNYEKPYFRLIKERHP